MTDVPLLHIHQGQCSEDEEHAVYTDLITCILNSQIEGFWRIGRRSCLLLLRSVDKGRGGRLQGMTMRCGVAGPFRNLDGRDPVVGAGWVLLLPWHLKVVENINIFQGFGFELDNCSIMATPEFIHQQGSGVHVLYICFCSCLCLCEWMSLLFYLDMLLMIFPPFSRLCFLGPPMVCEWNNENHNLKKKSIHQHFNTKLTIDRCFLALQTQARPHLCAVLDPGTLSQRWGPSVHRFNLHRNEKLENFVLDLKTNRPEFLLLGLWKMYSVVAWGPPAFFVQVHSWQVKVWVESKTWNYSWQHTHTVNTAC